jgi:protein SCO1/2
MARFIRWIPVLALALAASCGKAPENVSSTAPPANVAPTNSSPPHTYQVRGVVIEPRPAKKEVEIKHEAIPDYMPAMTMPFEVRDTNELAGLTAGDVVTFRLNVTDTEGWIDQIRKTAPPSGHVPTNSPANGVIQVVRDVEPLQVGDPLPDYHLTNQLGQPISIGQFKGEALAINFLFTRCPFPTFCPRMANNFAEVQQKMAEIPNAPTNWHLLTISFDPEFDTPEVLKRYGQAHGYDPSHCTLATGDLQEITALADRFGQTFWHDDTGSISHNLRAVVINAAGRVQRVFTGNEWNSAQLTAELVQATR